MNDYSLPSALADDYPLPLAYPIPLALANGIEERWKQRKAADFMLPGASAIIARNIHLSRKAEVIAQIESLIAEATRYPIEGGSSGDITLEKYLADWQATTPLKIAEYTSQFIDDAARYDDRIDNATEITIKSGNAVYSLGTASRLPYLLLNIKQSWGDGIPHSQSAPINHKSVTAGYLSLQNDVLSERKLVQTDPCARLKFREWLPDASANELFVLCANLILGPFKNESIELLKKDVDEILKAIEIREKAEKAAQEVAYAKSAAARAAAKPSKPTANQPLLNFF
jgi:hypothetical protein